MSRSPQHRVTQLLFGLFLSLLAVVSAQAAPRQAQTTAEAQAGTNSSPAVSTDELATAPTAALMKVYAELRNLQGSAQSGVVENAVWKRDAATFTFKTGLITFAAPVAGHVVAAVFDGNATFELDPPTSIEQHQIARFTGQPRLTEQFKRAVFFFTDDS
ncbi:MAG: hypothetical protein ACRD22_05110, partial [Terriglobia bacterium]